MKKIFFLALLLPVLAFGQKQSVTEFYIADSLIQIGEIEKGYLKLKELESTVSKSDTLYDYVLGYQIDVNSFLESEARMNEDFENSLNFGLEGLELIKKGKKRFGKELSDREAFMTKNIIVSYSGMKKYGEAQKYRDWLYKKHKKHELPDGIDEYFNFDYFRLDNKNIWGYEWFAELPKNRFSSSFSKIVYYVYSTNDDGSDKDQLYRLHVLMFHGNQKEFDYVMTKRLETATNETSGTLYAYTYKEKIDFEKLHNDIIEIVKSSLQPDTKTTIPKTPNENGKIEVEVEMNFNE